MLDVDSVPYRAVYGNMNSIAESFGFSGPYRGLRFTVKYFNSDTYASLPSALRGDRRISRILHCSYPGKPVKEDYSKWTCKNKKVCPHCRYRFVKNVLARSQYAGIDNLTVYRRMVLADSIDQLLETRAELLQVKRLLVKKISNCEVYSNYRIGVNKDSSWCYEFSVSVISTDSSVKVSNWEIVKLHHDEAIIQSYRFPVNNLLGPMLNFITANLGRNKMYERYGNCLE